MTSGNLEASPLLKEVVEQENTVGLALMPVMLPALCFFMMGLYRKEAHEDDDAPADLSTAHVARETVNTTVTTPKPPAPMNITLSQTDGDLWKTLHGILNGQKAKAA